MGSGLTATRSSGFSREILRRALEAIARGIQIRFERDPRSARLLGAGTVQLQALRAWMRFANVIRRSSRGAKLSSLGRCLHTHDPALGDPATWWVLHWELATNYVVWGVLSGLGQGAHEIQDIERALQTIAPNVSAGTITNARRALVRALKESPLGQELGLVQLEYKGRRVRGLTKLAVRYGQAPMAAVAYALVDWARREKMPSAALESLAAPEGPGPVLHMSEAVLERYLMKIDGAFRGCVLSYSRTAGLNEVYFKREVTPLQVLVSHYIRAREEIDWPEALARAQEEVPAADAPE